MEGHENLLLVITKHFDILMNVLKEWDPNLLHSNMYVFSVTVILYSA